MFVQFPAGYDTNPEEQSEFLPDFNDESPFKETKADNTFYNFRMALYLLYFSRCQFQILISQRFPKHLYGNPVVVVRNRRFAKMIKQDYTCYNLYGTSTKEWLRGSKSLVLREISLFSILSPHSALIFSWYLNPSPSSISLESLEQGFYRVFRFLFS
jgi:hypothetical protein